MYTNLPDICFLRYEIIGDKPGVAGRAWLDGSREMKQQLDTTCDYLAKRHASAKYATWKAELAPIFRWSESWDDNLFVTKKSLEHQKSRPFPYYTSEMLGRTTSTVFGSPCVAGASLFGNRMAYHKIGIRFANSDLTVFALATLYTACTKMGLLKASWEDMHFLISTHKMTSPMVPKQTGAYDAGTFFRQYLVALGLPLAQASNYTSQNAPRHEFVKKHHRRALSPTSEYVVALSEGFRANERLDTFDRGDLVETVLAKLTAGSKVSNKKKGTTFQPHFTVTEVLSTFRRHMIADEPHLNFDYLGFHVLGEKVRRGLHDLFPYIKEQHDIGLALWGIVFYILRDAARSPKENSLISKAATILQDIIYAPGVSNQFSKAARNASSGGIPKELAPNILPYNPKWTAEFWEYFADHHHGVMNTHLQLASFSASHLTFYDPEGSKETFDRVFAAAKKFWHLWRGVTIRRAWFDDEGVEQSLHTLESVQRDDGEVVEIPTPASIRSLGLRGREGAGIALLKQLNFRIEMMANGS